jgi:hypothetical protein
MRMLLSLALTVLSACGDDAASRGLLGGGGGGDDQAVGPSVQLIIDAGSDGAPISELVYGTNVVSRFLELGDALTLGRSSGNRYSTYNWETNASNAGYHDGHENGADLVPEAGGNAPGAAVIDEVGVAFAHGASHIVTVPMLGWVSADTDGVVREGEPVESRFLRSHARAPVRRSSPDLGDGAVYQDELVYTLERIFPRDGGPQIFYCLDNEPSLWDYNHPRAYSALPSYAVILERTLEYARAVKDAAPGALVFGLVAYGWDELTTFQEAEDRFDAAFAGRTFLEVFLDTLQDAEAQGGRRLVDALDLHWYPEALGGGVRIISPLHDEALVRARVQAPRSLWDETYVEDSYIPEQAGGPVMLLPRLHATLAARYPGTRLVISEYNFGGGAHISGALATADAVGVFGSGGVFAASLWELDDSTHEFAYAGLAMYRNFDGEGGRFGDLALPASASDDARVSVHAARDSNDRSRLTVVVINKTEAAFDAELVVEGATPVAARAHVLTSQAPEPRAGARVVLEDAVLRYRAPAMSVSTLVIHAP